MIDERKIEERKIVQRLHAIQDRHRFLKREEMEKLAVELGLKLRHLHEVASFFPHFRLSEPPAAEVLVCRDMACHLNGAEALTADLKRRLAKLERGPVHVDGASCLGQCDRAPAVRVDDRDCMLRDPAAIASLVADLVAGKVRPDQIPSHGPSTEGQVWAIDPYQGKPTYAILRRFVAAARRPEEILKTLEKSGLHGLGGPGARTYNKWADVRKEPGPTKYLVCNGDESEPGTFKDRELLLRAPHLIVEGMVFGALVVGASQGYVYIRHEYESAIEAMRRAIDDAYEQGVLGQPSMVTGRIFDLEVFVSPGGYICGEQTALIEAMEGHRSEPRNRPPELSAKGLFGRPTLLSNIETFAWVPSIIDDDAAKFLADGTNGSRGRRFFSISGDVGKPGVYEVPIGITVGDLIKLAGGLPRGLKALATSGPSGGFLPRMLPISKLNKNFVNSLGKMKRPLVSKLSQDAQEIDVLDLELDIQVFRNLDAPIPDVLDRPDGSVSMMLGAGIVVYGEGRDMADQALNCGRFYRAESCGKCVPCREGTQRIVEISERLVDNRGRAQDLEGGASLANELRSAMVQASICGLGQVAANPLLTAINHFSTDFISTPEPEPPAHG
jgi:NADH:ubiquinone oxidoreductase subunit F (NADH-binding)/NADH:ubiquinone oxidoreductase subunit E